jgi:Antibiotic biosynthesis monooxygenase
MAKGGRQMHAVVVKVKIDGDAEEARARLQEKVVPTVSQAPGFVAGYWTRSDSGDNGLSMITFESEDQAKQAAERVPQNVPESVTIESIEVREVVAHA